MFEAFEQRFTGYFAVITWSIYAHMLLLNTAKHDYSGNLTALHLALTSCITGHEQYLVVSRLNKLNMAMLPD